MYQKIFFNPEEIFKEPHKVTLESFQFFTISSTLNFIAKLLCFPYN